MYLFLFVAKETFLTDISYYVFFYLIFYFLF